MDALHQRERYIAFGAFEADRKARELRKQGRRLRLQDQPFRVLCMLLDHAGQVVTREELRKELWPASAYVDFDHGLNNAIARLRETLGDNAASPQFIETLPRVGYRFIYPVRTLPQPAEAAPPPAQERAPLAAGPARMPEPPPSALEPAAGPSREPLRRGIAPVAGVLIVAVLLGWWLLDRAATQTPNAGSAAADPSVAVLPFVSLTASPEDESFAAGLTEELLSQLARIRGLQVAGPVSSFRYKDRADEPAAVAEALHVDHLLQGSVRRAGDRVRITAQLTDVRASRQVWSETFERNFEDIFTIEDQIALAVAAALQVQLVDTAEHQLRRRGTRNAEAYRLYLMAMAKLRGLGVRLDRDGARQLFEQAIALDPGFAAAHAGLASFHFHGAAVSMFAPEDGVRLGRAAAERAMALDPESSEALRAMADFEMWRYRFRGEHAAYARADELFRKAIGIDPSNAYALFDYARAIQWCEPRRALQYFDRASEIDPLAPVGTGLAALALSRLGMHDAARARIEEYVARAGTGYAANVVGTYESYLGNLDHAAAALRGSPMNPLAGPRLLLWGIHESLGDADVARETLDTAGQDALTDALRGAVRLADQERYAEAFEHLDRARRKYPLSRVLDLPAARFAIIAGRFDAAREILEDRLPDLARGSEPITATRVLPALDLVLAWSRTGRNVEARQLLGRIEHFLGGSDRPQLPMFTVQHARAHALAGETDRAAQALERAFAEGFRQTCILDMYPQPLLYVDCIDSDPAFDALRRDGRFDAWLARIRADNRSQLARLGTVPVADANR